MLVWFLLVCITSVMIVITVLICGKAERFSIFLFKFEAREITSKIANVLYTKFKFPQQE